jgi:hypothetical protein
LRRPGAYRWPQHAAIFVVVAIAARSKIGCERTGTRATSGSSSSLHITESRSRHSRSRRRPRERSRRCGGGGGERRRTIASLAAASGGMHGYLQGRDAIEQASVSKRQSRLRLRLRRPGAYRWPGTPHGLKAEPQGAGSANVYSLRRSSGVGTVLICRRHQQWGGARIAAHPRREANGGRRPRRARTRSGSHRRQRLLRHHSAHRAWTGPTLRIRGPSCVYAAHRAFTRPIVRREVRECAPQVCIREKVRLRECWVRICKRCVYAPGCVYAR